MVSLVIDGSNGTLSVCCIKNNQILAESIVESHRNLSEIILKEIDNCLSNGKVSKNDLTEIVVTNGPGSYTALRVVLSIGKTLSYVLKIPIKTLSSLRLLAANYNKKNILTVSFFDGRRGNVYAAAYVDNEEVLTEGYYSFEELVAYVNNLNKSVQFITNVESFDYNTVKVGFSVVIKNIDTKDYLLIKNYAQQTTSFAAIPNYLRLTEAERSLKNDKN